MLKPITTILFATDLTENCRPAFNFAAAMATRYQATIVLLHVLAKMPDYVEGRLKGLMGEKQWNEIVEGHAKSARETLIGKKSSSHLIRAALEQFCSQFGIDDASCGYHSREIVVRDGEVVEEILSQSAAYTCDIIIMGARHGLVNENAVGSTIKGVLRRSKIPVLVVPPHSETTVI